MAYTKINWTEDETAPASGIPKTPVSATNLLQMETNLEEALSGTGSAPKIQEDALDTGIVTAGKIATNAITAIKINTGAITVAKIGAGAVTAPKMANDSVATGNIINLAVSEAKLKSNAVTTGKVAASAITEIKIADGAISAEKLKQVLADLLLSSYKVDKIVANDTWPQTTSLTFPVSVMPVINYRWRGKNVDPDPDTFSAWYYNGSIASAVIKPGENYGMLSHVICTSTYIGGDLTLSFLPVCSRGSTSGSGQVTVWDVLTFDATNKIWFYLQDEGGSMTGVWDSIEIEYSISAFGQL